MSDLVKLIDGPSSWTTALMAAVISSPRICCHLLPLLKLQIGVSLVVPWFSSYATWKFMDATGNPWGRPLRLCPIDSPLSPFFCVVNRRMKNSV